MKFKELINKSEIELKKDLESFKSEAENLRLKIRMGEVKNFKQLSKIKKDIARVLTRLSATK